MADPRPADPSIIERQVVLEAFRLAPGGESVVYVKRLVRGRTYRSHLWSVPYHGGRPRELTRGAVRDTFAAWRAEAERLGARRDEVVDRSLEKAGVARREDVEDLELRVAQLEHRLRLLEDDGAPR